MFLTLFLSFASVFFIPSILCTPFFVYLIYQFLRLRYLKPVRHMYIFINRSLLCLADLIEFPGCLRLQRHNSGRLTHYLGLHIKDTLLSSICQQILPRLKKHDSCDSSLCAVASWDRYPTGLQYQKQEGGSSLDYVILNSYS